MRRPLHSQAARQLIDRAFGRVVVARLRHAEKGIDRRNVDDAPALPLLDHDFAGCPAAMKCAIEDHVDCLEPLGKGCCQRIGVVENAGIVDEDIEAAECGDSCRHHSIGITGNVGGDKRGPTSTRSQRGGSRFAGARRQVRHHHCRTVTHKSFGHRPTDATCRAGDQRDLALQFTHQRTSPSGVISATESRP